MAQDRHSLERQLENAKSSLAAYESRRSGDTKKAAVEPKNDPQWRKLDKSRRNIVTRLQRLAAIEEQNAGGESEPSDD